MHASKISQQAATASQHWPIASQASPQFSFLPPIIIDITIIIIIIPITINTIAQIGKLSLFLLGVIIISIYVVYSFNKWIPKNEDLFSFLISINVISLSPSKDVFKE